MKLRVVGRGFWVRLRTTRLFVEQYDFNLISISVDGIIIRELPNNRVEERLPTELNIQAFPALFLMKPPDQIILIRQGVSSFVNLVDRVIWLALEHGLIEQKEYDKTRITSEPLPLSEKQLSKGKVR